MDTVQSPQVHYLTAAASFRHQLNQYKDPVDKGWILVSHAIGAIGLTLVAYVEMVSRLALSIILCIPMHLLLLSGQGPKVYRFYERNISLFTDRGIAFSLCLISPIILTNFIVLPSERKDLLRVSSEMSSTDALKNFLYKKIHNPSSSPQEENTHFATFQRLLLREPSALLFDERAAASPHFLTEDKDPVYLAAHIPDIRYLKAILDFTYGPLVPKLPIDPAFGSSAPHVMRTNYILNRAAKCAALQGLREHALLILNYSNPEIIRDPLYRSLIRNIYEGNEAQVQAAITNPDNFACPDPFLHHMYEPLLWAAIGPSEALFQLALAQVTRDDIFTGPMWAPQHLENSSYRRIRRDQLKEAYLLTLSMGKNERAAAILERLLPLFPENQRDIGLFHLNLIQMENLSPQHLAKILPSVLPLIPFSVPQIQIFSNIVTSYLLRAFEGRTIDPISESPFSLDVASIISLWVRANYERFEAPADRELLGTAELPHQLRTFLEIPTPIFREFRREDQPPLSAMQVLRETSSTPNLPEDDEWIFFQRGIPPPQQYYLPVMPDQRWEAFSGRMQSVYQSAAIKRRIDSLVLLRHIWNLD